MADALDSKSSAQKACGFESLLGQLIAGRGPGSLERENMLIQGHKRFKGEPYAGVQELRDFVADHRDVILGKPTVLLEPGELEKLGCFERTPDFVAIDVVSRHWAVVVIEPRGLLPESLAFRSLVKQEQIARRSGTRLSLSDLIIGQVKTRPAVLKNFEAAGVHAIDVRETLGEVFAQDPYFDLIAEEPSDAALEGITSAAPSFRVWVVRKFVQEGARENVIYEVPEAPRTSGRIPLRDVPPAAREVAPALSMAVALVPPKSETPAVPVAPPPPPLVLSESPPSAAPIPAPVTPAAEPSVPPPAAVENERPAALRKSDSPDRRIGFAAPGPAEPAYLQVADDENEVSLEALVKRGFLRAGERLIKRYRWATGEISQFEGVVAPDGTFQAREVKNPPQDSQGRPEDGMWRTEAGVTLADLKQKYLQEGAR